MRLFVIKQRNFISFHSIRIVISPLISDISFLMKEKEKSLCGPIQFRLLKAIRPFFD